MGVRTKFQVITYSRLRASKLYIICSYFKSLEFFGHPFRSHWDSFRENLLIKSRNRNILEKFRLNRNLQTIPFKMMYNMSMSRHRFSSEQSGGGAPLTTSLSYSVNVCNICMRLGTAKTQLRAAGGYFFLPPWLNNPYGGRASVLSGTRRIVIAI